MISDFFADPEEIVNPLRSVANQGKDLICFHVLDPSELAPGFRTAALVEDMETGEEMEVSADYARRVYPGRIQDHIETLRKKIVSEGADYVLLDTSQPLDLALREYLLYRLRRR